MCTVRLKSNKPIAVPLARHMLTLAGYTFASVISETAFSRLYRGQRNADGYPVVAKVLRSERPTRADLARVKHEATILQSLCGKASVVELVEAHNTANEVALVLEDLGDRSAASFLWRQLGLRDFLQLALAMGRAMGSVHRCRIIHKDLKPGHFLIVGGEAGGTVQAKIIDFGLATQLPEEAKAIAPEQLEGTLSYMSPEQTGRVNRSVNFRSDQYALGVCLYQLLTGVLPFPSTDPLQLVHDHIAKLPRPPHEVRLDVPRPVSDFIMKLLSKSAEDRYRSEAGLEFDLSSCLEQLTSDGHIPPITLGRLDFSAEPRIPQRLYGRESETEALLDALSRARSGAAELVLIRGGPGVGKSTLAAQLNSHLVTCGRFASGKFDQLLRNVPYAGLAQACRELAGSILMESAEDVEAFRRKVLRDIGENAQLLVALVPELGAILGPQHAPAELGPIEAQHRFERVFRTFLQLFATRESPLVLFLDDIQWADAASLGIIQGALTARGVGHLLIFGAYRDNEVSSVHPLSLALQDARKAGATISEIRLSTLGLDDVGRFLGDALSCDPVTLRPLAELMRAKTDGNPFFLGLLVMTMHRDGLLKLDPESGIWAWDLEKVREASLSDNVVEFMIDRLRRLSPEAQTVLMQAACVGHTFDRPTLSAISEGRHSAFPRALWEARSEGLIRLFGSSAAEGGEGGVDGVDEPVATYRFVHDRVRQAAYALIEGRKRAELHLRIGRLLLRRHNDNPSDANIFEVLNHLNLGADLLGAEEEDERRSLARLNLRAARQARDAAAHKTAVELLAVCHRLLGDGAWSTDYELSVATYLTDAQCQMLCGNLTEAVRLLDEIEERARTPIDLTSARSLRTTILTALNRLPEAIATAASTTAMFDVVLPLDPEQLRSATAAGFEVVRAMLAARSIESLIDLPPMRDPQLLALFEVFQNIIPAAYQTNGQLMTLVAQRGTELALQHGNAPVSPILYCTYGNVLARTTGDTATAYRFGQLGIELCRRTKNVAAEGQTLFLFAAALSHWRAHIRESVEWFRNGLKACLEGGDYLHAGYCAAHGLYGRFFAGEPIAEIASELPGLIGFCHETANETNAESLHILERALAALCSESQERDTMGQTFEASLSATHRAAMLLLKTIHLCLLGDFDGAVTAADAAPAFSPGFFMDVECRFFRALGIAGKLKAATSDARPPLLAALKDAERTFAGYAEGCPENHGVRHALLAAELAVVEGRSDAALDWYDRAIALAQEHGFLQLQAVANELCAGFHLSRNRGRIAAAYLQDAQYYYERWGAVVKSKELATRHANLLRPTGTGGTEPRTNREISTSGPLWQREADLHSGTTGPGDLDLLTVVRATRTIAAELNLGNLLQRLMRILLENAGAQRGVLVLAHGDTLEVAAEATLAPDCMETELRELLDESVRLPVTIVNYVARSGDAVVLDDACVPGRFARDDYLQRVKPRSVLCLALQHQGQVTGVLYLEHATVAATFNPKRVELLQFLAVQAAIAITNARLYDNLEDEVAQRTAALKLILDSTGDALLTVALDGRVDSLRSHAASMWFGEPCSPPETIWSLLHGPDTRATPYTQLAYEQLVAEVLPFESATAQMPARLERGARTLDLEWKPVHKRGGLDRILVVARDVSQIVEAERAEREMRELRTMTGCLLRDRSGFRDAIDEVRALLDVITSGERLDVVRRALHTLKGNAAMFGMQRLSERCHQVEDEVAANSAVPTIESTEMLRHELDASLQRLQEVFGADFLEVVELRERDIDLLLRGLQAREDWASLIRLVSSWRDDSLDTILSRFAGQAARIAKNLGKEVDVAVEERGVRIPSGELRLFWGVFVHVMRNAIDHGVEASEERCAAGKLPRARLTLRGELEGRWLTLTVEDDGRGIDYQALREAAIRNGLAAESHDDLIAALFAEGVSTKSEVTELSGRGIGMAALRKACESLGGTIAVDSQPMVGTRFTFRLPLQYQTQSLLPPAPRDSISLTR